jgi:hypothetical protein
MSAEVITAREFATLLYALRSVANVWQAMGTPERELWAEDFGGEMPLEPEQIDALIARLQGNARNESGLALEACQNLLDAAKQGNPLSPLCLGLMNNALELARRALGQEEKP